MSDPNGSALRLQILSGMWMAANCFSNGTLKMRLLIHCIISQKKITFPVKATVTQKQNVVRDGSVVYNINERLMCMKKTGIFFIMK